MKTQEEIQKAHDMIAAMLLGEAPIILSPDGWNVIHAAGDVLCWVLGHDHNKAFAENLKRLDAELRASGYELRDRHVLDNSDRDLP